jgi:hypothetical protein
VHARQPRNNFNSAGERHAMPALWSDDYPARLIIGALYVLRLRRFSPAHVHRRTGHVDVTHFSAAS